MRPVIYGCYNTQFQMLRKIRFFEDDTLYIIRDAIDRKNDGIKILLDVLPRPNVPLLMENHEYIMALLLSNVVDYDCSPKKLEADFQLWLDNGGKPTLPQFLALS